MRHHHGGIARAVMQAVTAAKFSNPQVLTKEVILGSDDPQDWDVFIGQERAKDMLKTACRAAKALGRPLPHVLLASGVPGTGKTLLAKLVAREMGTRLLIVSGKIDAKAWTTLLAPLEDGDILLIDEVHRLGRAGSEPLLHLMEDGELITGMGIQRRLKITVIGTTTDAGRLPAAVLERFPLRPIIDPYTHDEAYSITVDRAIEMFRAPLEVPAVEYLELVTEAGNRNPRLIRHLLNAMRDIAAAEEAEGRHVGSSTFPIERLLGWFSLTEDGLDSVQQLILVHLLDGAVGMATLQSLLREPGGVALQELGLLQRGYISISTKGRELTAAGRERALELVATARQIAGGLTVS